MLAYQREDMSLDPQNLCKKHNFKFQTVAREETKKREAPEVPRSVLLLSAEVYKRAGLKQFRREPTPKCHCLTSTCMPSHTPHTETYIYTYIHTQTLQLKHTHAHTAHTYITHRHYTLMYTLCTHT